MKNAIPLHRIVSTIAEAATKTKCDKTSVVLARIAQRLETAGALFGDRLSPTEVKVVQMFMQRMRPQKVAKEAA